MLPTILVVHVKRFTYDQEKVVKISADIQDPLAQVHIARHCYQVTAVVCHNGSMIAAGKPY